MGEWLFGSPAMLGWLAAAAAPWVIYYLHRPRRRELPWAAMMFLQRALAKSQTRRRSEWLLLALRTLAVAAIALAFADPRWTVSGETVAGRLKILVLDDSFSLSATHGRQLLWDDLRAGALRVLDAAHPGDRWQIVVTAGRPRAVFSEPTFDTQAVRGALAEAKPGQGRAAVAEAAAFVQRQLDEVDSREPRPQVWWFTDAQRTSWSEPLDGKHVAQFVAVRAAADSFVVLPPNVESNLAVTSIRSLTPLPITGRDVSLAAEVRNFGSQPRTSVAVRLFLNGEQAAEQRIDVPAEDAVEVRWERSFAAAGVVRVVVEVDDTTLEVDNRRYSLLDVRESIRVLALEGAAGDARPFALALEPNPGPAARILVERLSAEVWAERTFENFDLMLLADVPEVSPALGVRLREFVAAGGGLVIAPGAETRIADYGVLLTEPTLLPAAIEVPAASALTTFAPRDYVDPLVSIFRGRERGGLLSTPTWRHYRLRPNEAATIALDFADGTPAVVHHAFGAGRVYLWAIPFAGRSRTTLPDGAATPWTALDAWPSFVPLMQRQLELATVASRRPKELLVGETFRTSARGNALAWQVRPPTGESIAVTAESANDRRMIAFDATDQAGIYEVWSDKNVAERFVVNVDSTESDLSRVDAVAVRELLGESEVTASTSIAGSQRLFRPALMLAALLLVGESWLARRLGRSGR